MTISNNPVYCGDCIYKYTYFNGWATQNTCTRYKKIELSYVSRANTPTYCEIHNKDNDCLGFTPTIAYRLKLLWCKILIACRGNDVGK